MSPRISDLLSDANGLTSSGAAPALRQTAVDRQDEMRLVHRGMTAPSLIQVQQAARLQAFHGAGMATQVGLAGISGI